MEKEDQIIGMLERIMEKQDEHSRILGEHSQKLDEHSQILHEHSKKLDEHKSQLNEHKQILSALLTGQDYLKAEIDGMKLANAKEYGDIKEEISIISTNQELVRNDTWANRVDIHRIQKTMGMF
ncbi:hypothetical protein [Oceanobacillus chungangensis]|uniref:Uncharacterized protein n=1 Tax=Oceanobacillus chungangensis TaxID=1229152 RepID=A0A3D8PYT9_9BACI|nr:hypothetical protein [Oceanobacillus chungangensis]RDW20737.1 hypothetical protein CWR45_05800 [Oceanobacillus chungangensis]